MLTPISERLSDEVLHNKPNGLDGHSYGRASPFAKGNGGAEESAKVVQKSPVHEPPQRFFRLEGIEADGLVFGPFLLTAGFLLLMQSSQPAGRD